METVCFIVPHADDETLGFGGAIQHHVHKGDNVSVVICRAPHDERTQQQINDSKNALKILGVTESHYLKTTEIEMSHLPLNFFRLIEDILYQINPSVVYTTFWGDNHQDHKIVFDCVARATRVHGHLNVKQLLVGEILSSTDQAPRLPSNAFLPNTYLSLTSAQLSNKIIALQQYTTESKEYPHPRSPTGVELLAKTRGIEAGVEYAEAYMLIRNIK